MIIWFFSPTNCMYLCHKLQIQSLDQMIREGVLPFNIIAAILHLAIAAIGLYLLKKAAKHHHYAHLQQMNDEKKEDLRDVNFMSILTVSWLKKYTMMGSIFCGDNKYVIKEILIISIFGATLTKINKITLWPCCLSIIVLLVCFIIEQLLNKRPGNREIRQADAKIMNNQAQSQLEIEAIQIQPREPRIHFQQQDLVKESAKIKKSRTPLEFISISIFMFTSSVLSMQTIMTLSTSVSNSGELNISSLLANILIDQIAVRFTLGLLFITTIKIYSSATQSPINSLLLVRLFCSEEVAVILSAKEEERRKKRQMMVASPPRQKKQSPSRIPKAVNSAEKSSFLNLVNLQPKTQQQDDIVEEVQLTPAQKAMFQQNEGDNVLEEKNGFYTKRTKNKEKDYQWHSDHKGATTIGIHDRREGDDIIIFKDDFFDQMENVDEFWLEESRAIETKRKEPPRKNRNKRNLKLTGDSPYLEYLPNMLKKVDKFKDQFKEATTKPIR